MWKPVHINRRSRYVFILPRSGFVQLANQADNAAWGDSGLSYRFRAALRLIKSLGPASSFSENIVT